MTLCDTGPLVALINTKDADHGRCWSSTATLPHGPLVTTWPCFTEAMHLLFRLGGLGGQKALWAMYRQGQVRLEALAGGQVDRMATLMDQYQNVPMDLADASLIVLAETLGLGLIFSLDKDFWIYRLADGSALQVVP